MKRVIIVILFCFPIMLKAQSPFKFQVETRSGFEYNVFNANSSRFILSESGDSISAVQSSFFQHFNAQASWNKTFDAHQVSAKIRTQFDYFPQGILKVKKHLSANIRI